MTKDPVEVVKQFFATWSSVSSDQLLAFMTPDAIFHNIPIGQVVGHEAIREAFEAFFGMADNIDFEVRNVAGSGSVVFAERVDRFDMGDTHVDLPCNGVLEVVDGKIAAWRDYFDVGMFGQQAPDVPRDDLQKVAEAHGLDH